MPEERELTTLRELQELGLPPHARKYLRTRQRREDRVRMYPKTPQVKGGPTYEGKIRRIMDEIDKGGDETGDFFIGVDIPSLHDVATNFPHNVVTFVTYKNRGGVEVIGLPEPYRASYDDPGYSGKDLVVLHEILEQVGEPIRRVTGRQFGTIQSLPYDDERPKGRFTYVYQWAPSGSRGNLAEIDGLVCATVAFNSYILGEKRKGREEAIKYTAIAEGLLR